MRMQVALKVTEGKQAGTVIPLTRDKFLIGREEDCQLRPNSDLVSRHHCVIAIDDFTVRIRDLGSTNGTFVNNQRITTQVVMKHGDHVRIGKLAFEIQIQIAQPVQNVPESVAIDYTQGAPSGGDTIAELTIPSQLLDPNGIEGSTQMFKGDTTVVAPSTPGRPKVAPPPVKLPDPSDYEVPVAASTGAPAGAAPNKTNSAAEVIRQYMQRRPQ